MGSNCSLTFVYFKPYPGLNCMAGPDWSKKIFLTNEHQLCIETLLKLSIFRYGGFQAARNRRRGGRMHKTKKQTPTRQQTFKKGCVARENSTHGALFLEKVFCGLRSRTTFADVNNIKSSECNASV